MASSFRSRNTPPPMCRLPYRSKLIRFCQGNDPERSPHHRTVFRTTVLLLRRPRGCEPCLRIAPLPHTQSQCRQMAFWTRDFALEMTHEIRAPVQHRPTDTIWTPLGWHQMHPRLLGKKIGLLLRKFHRQRSRSGRTFLRRIQILVIHQ